MHFSMKPHEHGCAANPPDHSNCKASSEFLYANVSDEYCEHGSFFVSYDVCPDCKQPIYRTINGKKRELTDAEKRILLPGAELAVKQAQGRFIEAVALAQDYRSAA